MLKTVPPQEQQHLRRTTRARPLSLASADLCFFGANYSVSHVFLLIQFFRRIVWSQRRSGPTGAASHAVAVIFALPAMILPITTATAADPQAFRQAQAQDASSPTRAGPSPRQSGPGATETGAPSAEAEAPNADTGVEPSAEVPVSPGADDRRWIRTSSGNSVYFAYGSAQLTDSALNTIRRHADRLLSNPRLTVNLVGYTDDFSSSSYSIALGELRASAVRNELLSLKVASSQVRVTSYGHEKFPTVPCQTEVCRASYRRVEFSYPAATRSR